MFAVVYYFASVEAYISYKHLFYLIVYCWELTNL